MKGTEKKRFAIMDDDGFIDEGEESWIETRWEEYKDSGNSRIAEREENGRNSREIFVWRGDLKLVEIIEVYNG